MREIGKDGDFHVISWPFCLGEHMFCGHSWFAGWRQESSEYDHHIEHDANGYYRFEILSRHKPSPSHMTRIFVRAQMFDPFGEPTGGKNLKIYTEAKFKRLINNEWPVDSEIIDTDIVDRLRALKPYLSIPEFLKEPHEP